MQAQSAPYMRANGQAELVTRILETKLFPLMPEDAGKPRLV